MTTLPSDPPTDADDQSHDQLAGSHGPSTDLEAPDPNPQDDADVGESDDADEERPRIEPG